MPSLIGTTGTVFGPGIPLDGLTVYYDFSNPNCYAGTGTIVNNLAQYPNIIGNLSGSLAGGNPSFVLDGAKSYISFVSSSEQYMFYTLPTWGPSFTNISIFSSITSPTWNQANNEIGDMGAARDYAYNGITNGFGIVIYPGPGGSTSFSFVEGIVNPPVIFNLNQIANNPPSILTPSIYYHGYDHSTGQYFGGFNGGITESSPFVTPLPGRGTKNNTYMYFSRIDPISAIGLGSPRFTDTKLYLHMLYSRKLSRNEVNLIYSSLKNRFGF